MRKDNRYFRVRILFRRNSNPVQSQVNYAEVSAASLLLEQEKSGRHKKWPVFQII